MLLSASEILSVAIDALSAAALDIDDEQSVRGLDAMSELQLHALLGLALEDNGLGVHREAHYPSDGDAYTHATHRNRCDLALTPHPNIKLLDPASELKQLAIAQDTLFAEIPLSNPDPSTTCTPEDAMWIEIKTCAQHAYRDGVPSPNPSYAHQLVTGLQTDLCKLAADPHIWHAGVLFIVFTESETIARHDLNQAANTCMGQSLPIRSPLIATHPITDRAGNACVAAGFFPISI
jgi:hypothetical protein